MENRFARLGQLVGDYRLLRGLGTGGFGQVYLGEHIHEHTEVAVKVLRVRLSRSEELREFLNEARTMRLKHPHIVSLLDFGIGSDEVPFLVMEYAPHGSLRDRYPKGSRLSLPTVVSYVTPIASALQYAHDQRLIHRDVKPENLLVGQHQQVLLSDFGIAAVAHSSHSLITHEGIGGTLPYMAPEQIQGKPRPASDQYALGVVVYEWLCGARPFHGTPVELAMHHYMAVPPSLREQVPTLSLEVEQVVLRALAKDPKQRFAHIQEFAAALQEATRNEQGATRPPEQASHSVSLHPPPPPLSTRQSEEQVNAAPPALAQASSALPPPVSVHDRAVSSPATWPGDTHMTPPLFAQGAAVPSWHEPGRALLRRPDNPGARGSTPQHGRSRIILLLLLVLFLLLAGSGGLLYTAGKRAPDQVQATATSQALTRARAAAEAYAKVAATNGIMFGFNASHTHVNPYEQLLSSTTVWALTKKWAYHTADRIDSSPAVVNGVVYVGSLDGNLYALDVAAGTKKWAYHTGHLIDSSPAVVNGLVYVGSLDGNLYALDAAAGTTKWAYHTGAAIDSSPAVVNGVVYVGSDDGNLYAFHLPNTPSSL